MDLRVTSGSHSLTGAGASHAGGGPAGPVPDSAGGAKFTARIEDAVMLTVTVAGRQVDYTYVNPHAGSVKEAVNSIVTNPTASVAAQVIHLPTESSNLLTTR